MSQMKREAETVEEIMEEIEKELSSSEKKEERYNLEKILEEVQIKAPVESVSQVQSPKIAKQQLSRDIAQLEEYLKSEEFLSFDAAKEIVPETRTEEIVEKTVEPIEEVQETAQEEKIEEVQVKDEKSEAVKTKYTKLNKLGNISFWFVIVVLFLSLVVYVYESGGVERQKIFGFSVFRVLSESMQRDIPKGALVFVRETDPKELKVGDDITFLVDEKTTYTHRIIGIYNDYENSGQMGFETQGVENPTPDKDIVYAKNIIGKVVWQLPFFGQVVEWMKTNWIICLIGLTGLILATIALKILLKKEDYKEETEIST